MRIDPTYEEPFFFYGDVLVQQGRNAEAIAPLRQAIRNRSKYLPARVLLARALMNLKRWEEAQNELREAIRLSPDHPQPHVLLSQVYFRLGEEDKAKQEKEISLKLRRANPGLLEAAQGRAFRE